MNTDQSIISSKTLILTISIRPMCLSHLMLQNKIQPKCNISKNISYLLGFHNIQPQIFIGKTNAEALILWPLNAKRRLIGKDPDAGKS